MLRLFRRNGALRWYRRRGRPAAASTWGATAVGRAPAPPQQPPAWASWPTVASPQPGRVGWLTPAQTWRANGGRW
ncbi:hypothetical protein [Salinispora sp. H7-4]|uniref:hypothetical protein n=1 Tax=Salinispora sp. H7-4 TaxID=2748321 RepID=UPI0009B7A12E|nr:hypothetical protein [Salinispora sp. H7-4]NYT93579.1 hypothetical protein [Salinispora sp. H7-4]